MSAARNHILNKLRSARAPFASAPPRPTDYRPVTHIEDTSPEGLLERFTEELERLNGEVFVVDSDDAARDQVLALLEEHNTERISAWHFKHIPVYRLYTAIQQAGYTVDYPDIHLDDATKRSREIERLERATVGLTGADTVVATTGSLIVSTGPGRGRIPTVLPPVHIAVVTLDQFVPRLEDWLAQERSNGNPTLTGSHNICFITGPSRTADIEKTLVLGVHGPKRVQVIVRR
jgi:L-lactate dehydrogenase complex protein LldG